MSVTEEINFYNNTDRDVWLETWITEESTLQKFQIKSKEQKKIISCVGEWHLMAKNGHDYIGKFRSDPCASGNYSWIEKINYKCDYTRSNKLSTNNLALITLRKTD